MQRKVLEQELRWRQMRHEQARQAAIRLVADERRKRLNEQLANLFKPHTAQGATIDRRQA